MKKMKLGDLVEINPRDEKAYSPKSLVGFIPMAAVSEVGTIIEVAKRPYSEVAKGYTSFKNGDILFAKITPCMENGKAAIVKNLSSEHGFGSTEFHVLRPKPGVKVEFLFHLIHNNVFRKAAAKNMTGSAGQKRVPISFFSEFSIPLPPLDDQIRIATVLTRAEKLIAKRKESIKALDELLKSTFLEMFGDPVRNEKGWERKRIDEIAETRLGKMRDKQFITGEHLNDYLGNSNVRWFHFDFKSLEQMDFDEKEKTTFSLKYGDLLVCEGGEIGRCAIWRAERTGLYFQKALHRVRVNPTMVKQEFLSFVFLLYSLRNGFKNVGNKSTIAHLTGEKLKETIVPVPPIKLQNKFATITTKTESLKSQYTQSLASLENLYASLSQRAFKGELNMSRVRSGLQ